MDRGEHLRRLLIIKAPLNPNGPLCHRGQHDRGINERAGDVRFAKPREARSGQKCCIGHAILKLFQPRLHIAAKFNDLEIGAGMF